MNKRPLKFGTLLVVTSIAVLGALGLWRGSVFPWKRPPAQLPRELAIANLRTLGEVEIDETRPDRPVVKVSLRGRRVTDTTMDLVGELPELRSLTLADTRVTDVGIRRVHNLSKLQWLTLDGVAITDSGLCWLASLKNLEGLMLADTLIDGTGLKYLKPLDRLRNLFIEGTLVNADALVLLPGLTQLALLKTRLTDRGLEFLKGLPNLKELNLEDNTATFRGLAVLQGLPRLKRLSPGVKGSLIDLTQFQQANPGIQIIGGACGTPGSRRESELEHRQLRRQGFTGRLRLAWQSLL
jgi:hypothetical protein